MNTFCAFPVNFHGLVASHSARLGQIQLALVLFHNCGDVCSRVAKFLRDLRLRLVRPADGKKDCLRSHRLLSARHDLVRLTVTAHELRHKLQGQHNGVLAPGDAALVVLLLHPLSHSDFGAAPKDVLQISKDSLRPCRRR